MKNDVLTPDLLLKKNLGSLRSKWHWMIFFILIFYNQTPYFLFPSFALTISVPHRCRIPAFDDLKTSNLSYTDIANLTIPLTEDNLKSEHIQEFESCKQYSLDWLESTNISSSVTFDDLYQVKQQFYLGLDNSSKPKTESCRHGYVFDTTKREHKGTLVEEFGIVCQNSYLVPTGTAIFNVGQLIACFTTGYLADRFGRRRMILLGVTGGLVSAFSTSFSTNMVTFCALRLILGFMASTGFSVSWVLLTEISTSKLRNIFMAILWSSFTIFQCLFVAFNYQLQNWRYVHAALGVISLPSFLAIFFVPESPRWLLAMGRREEALQVIEKTISFNRKGNGITEKEKELFLSEKDSPYSKDDESENEEIKLGILQRLRNTLINLSYLFRRPLGFSMVVLIYVWFVVACQYVIITFNAVKLKGSPYVALTLLSVATIPSALLQVTLYHRFNRKPPVIGMLVATVPFYGAIIIYQFLQPESNIILPITICATVAILFVDSTEAMNYIFAPEIFPTELRATAMGVCEASKSLGFGMAPILVEIGQRFPYVFGVCTSVGAIVLIYFVLPETKNRPLFDTVVEMKMEQRNAESNVEHE